jgi:SAM-dependent methyltransferase
VKHEEIARVYEGLQRSSAEAPRTDSREPYYNYLVRFLPKNRNARILDAGCGNGKYANTLSDRGYRNIVGIDLFDGLDTSGAFHYQRNSIDAIDLPDASVDFLYCFSVIFYLAEPSEGLKEFHRVMKPGSILVISAHTKYSLFTLERIFRRAFGKAPHLKDVRFYSAGEYVRMMEFLRFEILDVDGHQLFWVPPIVRGLRNRFLRVFLGKRKTEASRIAAAPRVPEWMKKLRSIFGYHFLIAARKGVDA